MGDVFDAEFNGNPSICFPWNVARLPSEVMDFDNVEKVIAPQRMIIRARENGLIEGQYIIDKTSLVFIAAQDVGYNITLFQGFVLGKKEPAQTYTLKWKKANDVWFIAEMRNELGDKEGDGLIIQQELHYESFAPNIEIPTNTFRIEAAKLPDGVRILDHRPKATQREYYYYNRLSKSAKGDSIMQGLEQMPGSRLPD